MSSNKVFKSNIVIEWHSIARDLFRNAWVIVMAALIAMLGAYVVRDLQYKPQYTSTATLVVSTKSGSKNTYTSYSQSAEIASILAKVFDQPSMKTKAAENIGADSFNGTMTAYAQQSTNILELTVTADDPQTAYMLLTSILEVYPQISTVVFNNAVIDVLKMPAVAHNPANQRPGINKLLFLGAGAAFAIAVIVFLSLIRDTVKDEDSFRSKVDAKLIGTVVHEQKRKTISDLLKVSRKKALLMGSGTGLSLKFAESYHKIATRLEYMNHRNGDRVFAITSVAENEGKSTAAANIAIALANKGNKVMLIDLDAKKPALYKIFNAKYEESAELGELFSGKISSRDYSVRKYKKTSLFLALNTKTYKDYQKWIEDGTVRRVVELLKSKVDFIILDTAPIIADSTITNVVQFADETLLVVRTDVVLAANINDAVLTINEVGGKLAGCILNNVYPEFSLFGQAGADEGGYYYGKSHRYGRYKKYYGYNNSYAYGTEEPEPEDSTD